MQKLHGGRTKSIVNQVKFPNNVRKICVMLLLGMAETTKHATKQKCYRDKSDDMQMGKPQLLIYKWKTALTGIYN